VPELAPTPALGGHAATFGETSLAEVVDRALVSIAVPLDGRESLASAVASAWGIALPEVGRTERTADGRVLLLGLASDQLFASLPARAGLAAEEVAAALDGAGYLTEQSDAWVTLRLAGPLAVPALERICPLDLDPRAFPPGGVARTVMEHLGAILVREAPDAFLLLSARSYAGSFLHAVETSLRNVA
jgi:sarcosine oxidase subunit gamma